MELLVKTLAGLEEVLAQELKDLGATEVEPVKRAVKFRGDLEMLYRANFELRTAVRILLPIATFQTRHPDSLYRRILKIDWSEYMGVDNTLAVDAVTHSPHFTHSKYAALKVKDAIVDQFRKNFRRRPNVNPVNPDLRINVHISNENCTVSLDSSGDSLHKRGYRTEILEAPINEVLAAGMILLTGWQRDSHFIDPMCGSGTIPIEAALYAWNIPPQINRQEFGFMKWRSFDPDLWEKVVQSAKARQSAFEYQILGYDKSFKAARIAQFNVEAAKLEDKIVIDRKSFEKLSPPEGNGIIIMNPPYDERLEDANINDLYKSIGNQLKREFPGYEAWIISSNFEALKNIGLRPAKKIPLYNGSLECKFQKFELYQGSRKQKKILGEGEG